MSYEAAGGLFDTWEFYRDMFLPGAATQQIAACVTKAAAAELELLRTGQDIEALWQPGKTVLEAQVALQLFDWSFAMMTDVTKGLDLLRATDGTSKPALRAQLVKLYDLMDEGREVILKPTQAAMAAGAKVVDSAAIRGWQLDVLRQTAEATKVVTFSKCAIPSWVTALNHIIATAQKIKALVVRVAAFVADVAEFIAKLPGRALDFFGTLVTLATVAAGGYVAYRVYGHVQKRKRLKAGSGA